jgi:NADH-quinone oxidoreductase subunit J
VIEQIFFWIFALGAVASGLMMVTRRMPVHSAVAFLGTLVSLAGLFLLLIAQFVAVMQIVIYAGAILVLFLFVIMLLHAHSGEGPVVKLPLQKPLAWVLSLAFVAGITAVFLGSGPAGRLAPPPEGMGTAEAVGTALFARFILPFEVASVLLLAGILGAVVLGGREKPTVKPEEPEAEAPEPKEEVKV